MQSHKKAASETAGRGGVVSSDGDAEGMANTSGVRSGRTGVGAETRMETSRQQMSDRG